MINQRVFLLSVLFSLLIASGCARQLYLPIAAKRSSGTADLPITQTQAQNSQNTLSGQPGNLAATPAVFEESTTPTAIPQLTPATSPTGSSRLLLPYLSKPQQPNKAAWRLAPRVLQGNKENEQYILRLQYPAITGETHPLLTGFTQQIQTWISEETNLFLVNTQAASAQDLAGFMISTYAVPSSANWSLETAGANIQVSPPTYEAAEIVMDGGAPIISVLMSISEYYGGVHPGERHISFNYDLQTGDIITLADLFQNSQDYLAAIARYSINELYRRADLSPQEIDQGAAPLSENYRIWNITPQGLLITFEEYQVGPYVAGSQQVLIPYENLKDLLRSDGPLSKFARMR